MTEMYEGTPCAKCGGTKRWRSSRHCVNNNNYSHMSEQRREHHRKASLVENMNEGRRQRRNATAKRRNNSMQGYLKRRMRDLDNLVPKYQQKLEAIQKELRDLENG